MAKILCGCSVRQDPLVFEYYYKSLQDLTIPEGSTIDFCFVDDNDEGLSADGATILAGDSRAPGLLYTVGDQTHNWNAGSFQHLARQKQRLLDKARDEGYTHFFLVDSDLILEPNTLQSLLSADVDIVNAVFYTAWNKDGEYMPQVWTQHPYGFEGLGKSSQQFRQALYQREFTEVLGGGACTLVKTDVLDKVTYAPIIEGLPEGRMWQGEDRSFALRATQHHIKQYADPWPTVLHMYHPGQRTIDYLQKSFKSTRSVQQTYCNFGDLVSLKITNLTNSIPLQPEIMNIRGRLGAIQMLEEIEQTILEMQVGSERIITVTFPHWYPLAEFRGVEQVLRIQLNGAKPWSKPDA